MQAAIDATDPFTGVRRGDYATLLAEGQIRKIPDQVREDYLAEVLRLQLRPGILAESGLVVAYSPLNGAGHRPVIDALTGRGWRSSTWWQISRSRMGIFPPVPPRIRKTPRR